MTARKRPPSARALSLSWILLVLFASVPCAAGPRLQAESIRSAAQHQGDAEQGPEDRAQVEMGSPDPVAEKVMVAMTRGDLETMASLMDPAALDEFRSGFIEVFNALEDLPQEDREAAEFEFSLFFGADLEDLRKLDAPTFFLLFLQNTMALLPDLTKALSGTNVEVVGHVLEREDLAHVIARYEMLIEDVTVTEMTVVSLRRTDGHWRVLPSGNLRGIADAVRQQILGP